MIVWQVSIKEEPYGSDISCAWSTKEAALAYFRKEIAYCSWKVKLLTGQKSLLNNDSHVEYLCTFKDQQFTVGITPLFLDEVPYIE